MAPVVQLGVSAGEAGTGREEVQDKDDPPTGDYTPLISQGDFRHSGNKRCS